ncbi:ABC transporter permease [Pseudonocardia sp. MH-G8]|uniref:ABC transporter permease n=1 Tax=Pseudonocardia sp. MH-G8 TaxID=1854588 RepID=UPI000BA1790D|nr:ABC transporter permease [Pseudonocardia sp. MH-G8]OZM83755.1 peptide ABC transporter permease [Pseudonocardia sp. MH-G8]
MSDPSALGTAGPIAEASHDLATAAPEGPDTPRSLASDAWHDLRRRPLFLISVALIAVLLVLAAFPQLFTSVDPTAGELARSRQAPSAQAWFGYDLLGRDVFARTIYGTRVSIIVGVLATTFTLLIGGVFGLLAGFYGGWVDNLVSRFTDVFFGLPFVLGAIVILSTFRESVGGDAVGITSLVVLTMAVLSWPVTMRIMRSAAIAARDQDYVRAARALGASPARVIWRHMLPNCLAPVLVYATISLGSFIGAEATLSFLGIGLRDPVVSWGVMISEARDYLRVAPFLLLFPAAFLAVTVLAFVMLGDAVREAFDPKGR